MKYLSIAIGAGILDLGVSLVANNFFRVDYQIATNMGIIIGFIFQYFTSLKYVFKSESSINNVIIYLITWIIGILIANIAIFISFEGLNIPYLFAKGISMVIPFFFTYYIRNTLLKRGKKRNEKLL